MRHSVSTEILQNVLNYLADQPYKFVNQLVTQLQNDAKLIEAPDTASKPQLMEAQSIEHTAAEPAIDDTPQA